MPRILQDGLPGQRYPTPNELDSSELFYSSLWREKKLGSRMATNWMLEHGLLDEKLAGQIDAMGKNWNLEDVKAYLPIFKFPAPKKTIPPKKPFKFPTPLKNTVSKPFIFPKALKKIENTKIKN